MQVLLIGYGKIGRIKSRIWQELGAEVTVYDTNQQLYPIIRRDGFKTYDRNNVHLTGIVDISTPAGQHFKALKWILEDKLIQPTTILIEKPLASSLDELNKIKKLTQTNTYLQKHIFVNETYYHSIALKKILKAIRVNNEKIKGIYIELSKNRLQDLEGGRFFDQCLGAVGIEIPHMLAILHYCGLTPHRIAKMHSQLMVDASEIENQAFYLSGRTNEIDIRLVSCIGNFRVNQQYLQENKSIIRRVLISTATIDYEIYFDPAPDIPRYHCCINTYANGHKISSQVVEDNHLREHIQLFMNNRRSSLHEKIGLLSALELTESLITIREKSMIKFIHKVHDNPAISARKEQLIQ